MTRKETIKGILEMAKKEGYKAYLTARKDAAYGWLVTPSNNILYIQCGEWGGYDVSLQHRPTRANGSACCCSAEVVNSINIDTLKRLEKDGIAFAKRLRATFYTNKEIENYFLTCWDRENICRI